jgi:aminoglycoside phosphotransferase family enzyme/predicted kinase
MPLPAEQEDTVALLCRLSGRDPVETHISAVFIGPDTVWKLKKAVRLSFLDFATPAARHRFLLREAEVNRPAAPDLYRDVVPVIRQADGALALGTAGSDEADAIDWVLRMAPVPAQDFLDAVATRGALTPSLLDAVADTVAAYHQALPASRRTDPAAEVERVARGNAQAASEAGLPADRIQAWLRAITDRIAGLASWLAAREANGFLRRAHGDLHLGNLCLWHGRPVPFDAIEFDEAMATIDLGYDLAFLLMDLHRRVSCPAANRVLNRYVARTGDAALTRGLPVFLSLRAMIRAHVEARRDNAAVAADYLDAALTYLDPSPPVIIAVGGLPGTGKSTLARALAPPVGGAPGALVLRSDEIRKRQHGVPPEQRLPQDAYTEAASTAVFAELSDTARTVAGGGHAVIADAMFQRPAQRSDIATAAAGAGVPFLGLWLTAPLQVLEARVHARSGDASDATVAVLHAAARNDDGGGDWLAIDASNADTALAQATKAVQSPLGSHRWRKP